MYAQIEASIAARIPGSSLTAAVLRTCASAAVARYINLGLADQADINRLKSADTHKYYQGISEIIVHDQLASTGRSVFRPKSGPDFFFKDEGRKIHVEVICPEPTDVPAEWLNPPPFRAINFPHEAVLRRWTSAIKEKSEKLARYLSAGLVGPDDVFVIAVNGRLLRGGPAQLEGISGLPYAVEATLQVGPFEARISRHTQSISHVEHSCREAISSRKDAPISCGKFLTGEYSSVSAIWAIDADERLFAGVPQPMAVIHNPKARNRLSTGILPAHAEYSAEAGELDVKIHSAPGNLQT